MRVIRSVEVSVSDDIQRGNILNGIRATRLKIAESVELKYGGPGANNGQKYEATNNWQLHDDEQRGWGE